MEERKATVTKHIFIPWPDERYKRRRSMSYATPPDVKWSEKIKSLRRPKKP